MEILYHFGLLVVLGFGLVAHVINVLVMSSVKKTARPEKLIDILENGPAILSEGRDYAALHRWAEIHDFTPEMVFDFRANLGRKFTIIGVWRSRVGQDLLVSYNAPKLKYVEFVTTFDRSSDLTTSSTRFGVMVPNAPARYVQAFDGLGLDNLFKRHNQGLEHLRRVKQLSPVHIAETADRLIAESLRHQMAYIQSLPLWQLRGAWWYWGRRNLLNNKTIAERYPRG